MQIVISEGGSRREEFLQHNWSIQLQNQHLLSLFSQHCFPCMIPALRGILVFKPDAFLLHIFHLFPCSLLFKFRLCKHTQCQGAAGMVQARLNQAERLKICHHPLHSLAAPLPKAIFPLLLLGKPAGCAS